jgi:hypothetical protein
LRRPRLSNDEVVVPEEKDMKNKLNYELTKEKLDTFAFALAFLLVIS